MARIRWVVLVLRSHVTVQIALLRESAPADGTDKFGLHAALVLLMPPQGREEGVNAIALGANVLLYLLPVAVLMVRARVRLRALVALERLVAHQRGLQAERAVAIVAEVLTATGTVVGPAVLVRGHRAQASGVHSDARRRRQGGYRPVGRTVDLTCESRRVRMRHGLSSVVVDRLSGFLNKFK